ncbi:hypothetical protein OEB99_13840 [Actinotalea sp. M2MS4P-6]|nr:hypothetical protein [Actinotalea sp. M2MS4P-6]MCV2395394.1 hypothetical protein [Actinotalea sp. M2MS4P-6]
MTRRPIRRTRPTPYRDPESRRLLRELELAEERLTRIHTDAVTELGRF